MQEIDVLVVGAGPAGSAAAAAAARAGAKTLLIDRKKEIGTPVQCGEVIGKSLLQQAGIKLPRQAVCRNQASTRFLIDRRLMVVNREPYWASVTVERKILDKLFAVGAAEAGARVEADTRLTELHMEGDQVEEAILMQRGKEVRVKPRMVIAADGVHSTVSKLTGFRWYPEEMVARGGEFEMVSKKPLPPSMQIILEPEVGLGYGWIIPKGKNRANVGLARVGASGNRMRMLEEWVEDHPLLSRYFDGDSILEVKTGDAPVPGVCGDTVRGNIIFTGDAAGQTLAFVGEGIIPSYVCGMAAGEAAASYDSSLYGEYLDGTLGEELRYGADLKDQILGLWEDETLNDAQRVLIAGLVMSECLVPEDLEMLLITDPNKGSGLIGGLRQKLRAEGRDITVSPISPGRKR